MATSSAPTALSSSSPPAEPEPPSPTRPRLRVRGRRRRRACAAPGPFASATRDGQMMRRGGARAARGRRDRHPTTTTTVGGSRGDGVGAPPGETPHAETASAASRNRQGEVSTGVRAGLARSGERAPAIPTIPRRGDRGRARTRTPRRCDSVAKATAVPACAVVARAHRSAPSLPDRFVVDAGSAPAALQLPYAFRAALALTVAVYCGQLWCVHMYPPRGAGGGRGRAGSATHMRDATTRPPWSMRHVHVLRLPPCRGVVSVARRASCHVRRSRPWPFGS